MADRRHFFGGELMKIPNAACPVSVCRLSLSSIKEVHSIEQESNSPPWSENLLEREFTSKVSLVYGAYSAQNELMGFLISHATTDEGQIVNFAIKRKYRGQGVGRALLTAVLQELYWRGVRWVTLEVRKSGYVAQSLYTSLGFTEVGQRKAYYTNNNEDAIVMSLNVSQFMNAYEELERQDDEFEGAIANL